MSMQLLEKLEAKVDQTVEIIEIMRLQIEELEEKNHKLQDQNNGLKDQLEIWESTLQTMLEKLNNIENAEQVAVDFMAK